MEKDPREPGMRNTIQNSRRPAPGRSRRQRFTDGVRGRSGL